MKINYKNVILIALTAITLSATAKEGLDSTQVSKNTNQSSSLLFSNHKEETGVDGKFIITAGIGLNFFELNYKFRYDLSNFYDNNSTPEIPLKITSTPMINAQVDYGLGKRVTIGVAFGYQKTKANWSAFNLTTVNPNQNNYYVPVTDTWTRTHFAARGDYQIVAKDEIGLYTGIKLGINLYNMTSTYQSQDPNYVNDLGVHFSPISAQAHFGFNYWFEGLVGVNVEAGIGYGGPYVLAIGVTAKL